MKLLIECFFNAKRQIITTGTAFLTIWGIITVIFPIDENLPIYLMLVTVTVALIIVFLVRALISLRKTEVDIPMRSSHGHFILMKDDYVDNMKRVIAQYPNMEQVCFAMGMDRTGTLEISTKKGVLYYVIQYLQIYNVTVDDLQKLIVEAMQMQYGKVYGKDNLEYGSVLVVRVKISEVDTIKLLLVANSEKTKESKLYNDRELVTGVDSRSIILKVFEKCSEISCETMMIAAMGTNGLNFPIATITAEIINAYSFCIKKNQCPKNLLYSVREKDLERQDLKQSEIIAYVHQLLRMCND